MYVEDLVLRLACDDKYLFEPTIIQGNGWETNFVSSLSTQISRGNALTEKQATLAQRIIKKYQASLEVYFQRSIDVDNPVYKQPFRKISNEKSVKIEMSNGNKVIAVRFAYDADIIKQIQEYLNNHSWKSFNYNNVLKGHIAEWNPDSKAWSFCLREDNILWIANNLLPKGFQPDETFNQFLTEINSVMENMFDHAPHCTKVDSKFTFKNVSQRVPVKETEHVLDFLFTAKNYGVTAWDDNIDQELNSLSLSPITQILLNSTNPIYVDSNSFTIEEFTDIIKFGGPLLIIIPGGSEVQHTIAWHKLANRCGINNEDISVLFRMPNESHGEFNSYVKANELNNEITDSTKLVFVSTKIPKPLVKSGLKFNSVINLGYYRDLHFSMSVLLQSTPNIVYYNNKQPHGVNICPQQN